MGGGLFLLTFLLSFFFFDYLILFSLLVSDLIENPNKTKAHRLIPQSLEGWSGQGQRKRRMKLKGRVQKATR